MQKKIKMACLVMLAIMVLSICGGCSSQKIDASDEMFAYATEAVAVVDDYLYENLLNDETVSIIDELYTSAEVWLAENSGTENYLNDSYLLGTIYTLSEELDWDVSENTASSYNELVAARNSLASSCGIKKNKGTEC